MCTIVFHSLLNFTHTSHNDFCLFAISMLCHIGQRSFVEPGPWAADVVHPKNFGVAPPMMQIC